MHPNSSIVVLTDRSPVLYEHITRGPGLPFALHLVATVADAHATIQRAAPVAILVDLTVHESQRICAQLRQYGASLLLGIVERSAAAELASRIPSHVDGLIVRTAAADEWSMQIHAARHRRQGQETTGIVQCGDVTIDLAQQTVVRAGTTVRLPATEWRILCVLAHHAPHPVPNVLLVEQVWGRSDGASPADVRKWMSRLRTRLGDTRQRYLQTAGHGQYRLVAEPVPLSPQAASATRPCAVALPMPITSFVGRAAERADLQRLLAQSTRLLTLIGTAGIGKTRLALHAAHDAAPLFRDALYFLPLADLTHADQVLPRLARILNIPNDADGRTRAAIVARLQERRTLLLVDNIEHLIDDVAVMLANLLQDAPALTIMATSREPLQIYGEQLVPIAPLALPELPTDHVTTSPAVIAKSDAVQLFLERAQLVQPQFTLTEDTVRHVAQICQHLSGVPLAIELAAARLGDLPVDMIANGLAQQHHLDVLISGMRDRALRQQTIRGALAWSYALLTPTEQQVFRCLGCFAADFTAEAVHAIWQGTATLEQTQTLLHTLTQKSLLVPRHGPGGPWWGMLESLRVYAAEAFTASGERAAMGCRRTAYYRALSEAADEGLIQADQAVWMARLERDYATIHAVLKDADQQHDTATLQQITGGIWRFWMMRGTIREGRQWCQRALADDVFPAEDQDAETLSSSARAWNGAGVLAMLDGDHTTAHHLLTQALDRYQRAHYLLGEARVLMNLGIVAHTRGEEEAAQTWLEASLDCYRSLNDRSRMIGILFNLSEMDVARQHYDRAETRLRDVIALCREFGYPQFEASAYETCGNLATLRDQFDEANVFYKRSCDLYHTIPSPADVARLQVRMAETHAAAAPALTLLDQVFRYIEQTSDVRTTLHALEAFSRVLVTHGHPYAAAQMWGAAGALRNALSLPQEPHEHHLYDVLGDQLVDSLGYTTAQAAEREGAAMALQDVVTLARTLTA